MRGVTRMRDGAGGFPFVEGLVSLAAEVRSILGPDCKISYAADWTEYGAYVPGDGSDDVLFPLDAFWGDQTVDFVGVDWYPPAGDWRSGEAHLDALAGFEAADDPAYLLSQMAGGEAYDWFYASDEDRQAQLRTPIQDTAHNEHWVFRQKDLLGWWDANHHERSGGVRSAAPTDWVAGSKPIRLSEIGFPALDRGGNSPNLFFDPKSSESAFPPFSTGERDDLYQRAALDVALSYWQGQGAVEQALVWAWDARPWPVFPIREDIWTDGSNWAFGHWLNGRAGLSALGGVLTDIAARGGVSVDASAVIGLVDGFTLTGVSTLRSALEPLMAAYGLEMVERGGDLVISMINAGPVNDVIDAELAEGGIIKTRRLLDKVPGALRLTYIDGAVNYQPAIVEAREPSGDRSMVIDVSMPLVLTETRALAIADFMLGQVADGDEATLGLPMKHLALEAGDGLRDEDDRLWRVTSLTDRVQIDVSLRPETAELETVRALTPQDATPNRAGLALPGVLLIDGPVIPGAIDDARPLLAGIGQPWPGPVNVSAGIEETLLSPRADIVDPAGVGRLIATLLEGPLGRWDNSSELVLEIQGEQLPSLSPQAALAGTQPILVQNANGWELVSYRDAELIGQGQYRLTGLLRGLQGSEIVSVESGAICVMLDARLGRGNIDTNEIGLDLFWQVEGRGLLGDLQLAQFENKAGLSFSPVHLRQSASPDGALLLSWVRRGAEITDSWILPDSPNEGRFRVCLKRGQNIIFDVDIEAAALELPDIWQDDDEVLVYEYGQDGRLGYPARLRL